MIFLSLPIINRAQELRGCSDAEAEIAAIDRVAKKDFSIIERRFFGIDGKGEWFCCASIGAC
jgi:hypothetical protein